MSLSGHQSARMGTDEWLTPPEILRVLGPFDLDPCAPVNRPWPTAAMHYTVRDDGLAQVWNGRVWCNPPFGREAVKWLRRMRDHGNGVALIPARTETAMFYETVWGYADGVLFLRSRPHFHYVDGRRAPFNSGHRLPWLRTAQRTLLHCCGLALALPLWGITPEVTGVNPRSG